MTHPTPDATAALAAGGNPLRAWFEAWHKRRRNHPDFTRATDKERAWLAVCDLMREAPAAAPAGELAAKWDEPEWTTLVAVMASMRLFADDSSDPRINVARFAWEAARKQCRAPLAAGSATPAGWKLVEDFRVGSRVVFEGAEHVIFARGDRPGTFDIQLPSRTGDRWRNVPPSALKYAPSDPHARPAAGGELEAFVVRDMRQAAADWNQRLDAGDHPHVIAGTGAAGGAELPPCSAGPVCVCSDSERATCMNVLQPDRPICKGPGACPNPYGSRLDHDCRVCGGRDPLPF